MNTSKIALYTNSDETHTLTLTPAASITSMFDHTDKDGTLYIPEWPYDGNYDEKQRFYKCAMNWNKADLDDVLRNYESCYHAFEEIAAKREPDSADASVDSLPSDLRKVWDTYIRDFETGDMDLIEDAVQADVECRVGGNVAAYDVVIRARRLCKLLALGAPEVIIDNEANLFAQALVIHKYCKEMTVVDDVE